MKKGMVFFSILMVVFLGCKQEQKQALPEAENVALNASEDGALQITSIDSTQFPAALQYEGFIKNAVRWKDASGDNIVLTTETGIHRSEKFKHEMEDSQDAELFGYHFLIQNNAAMQTWKVYDYIKDCPVDIVASFVEHTFSITDLNKNGIAEVWLMYKTVCHGDVSPSDMKIIMYEGKQKFAVRGQNKVQTESEANGEKSYIGGEYTFDEAFDKGPKEFKDYALNLWDKNSVENWDN